MAAACCLVVESSIFMCPSTFGHDPTCVYVSYRPNESFVPKQQRNSTYLLYTVGGKLSDKNLEQQINVKFCVKISKSVSGTLALLTLDCGKYAMKKLSFFEWHRRFKEGREDVQDDLRSG
jgi:hypothetical protein